MVPYILACHHYLITTNLFKRSRKDYLPFLQDGVAGILHRLRTVQGIHIAVTASPSVNIYLRGETNDTSGAQGGRGGQ